MDYSEYLPDGSPVVSIQEVTLAQKFVASKQLDGVALEHPLV
jgi:hypothetical protein